jgi:uncharacterized membrane protein YfhO
MTVITALVVYYAVQTGDENVAEGPVSTFLTDIYTKYGIGIVDMLRVNFDSNLFIFIPILVVFLVIFSIAERKIFKRI